jgi:hypothetical protein
MNDKKNVPPSKPAPKKIEYGKVITYDHGIVRKDSQVTKVTNSLPPPPPKKKPST